MELVGDGRLLQGESEQFQVEYTLGDCSSPQSNESLVRDREPPDEQTQKQLITRRPFPLNVPDHLADTKIYPVANSLSPFQSSIGEVHFAGFVPGKKRRKRFQLINKSASTQRYHLLPPTTNHFTVSVQKNERGIVPGMGDTVVVEFLAHEAKDHFYDYIRVHCANDQNLLIPLHAYPLCGMKLPQQIRFRRGSILESQSHAFKLSNTSHCAFEYRLNITGNTRSCFQLTSSFSSSSSSSSLSSSNLAGTLPPGQTVEVAVVFAPPDYVTSTAELILHTNELFSKPQVCQIVASSAPGLPTSKET